MTPQEHITAIRTKCIEANSEIELREPRGFMGDPDRHAIRLADVLLAIEGSSLYVADGGEFFTFDDFDGPDMHLVLSTGVTWNLRHDDLAEQTPETLAFIHNLLCV